MSILSNIVDEKTIKKAAKEVLGIISKAVEKSLGPNGSTTIIEGSGDIGVETTKDGYKILKNINFADPIARTFLKMFSDMSFDQVLQVGDGSSTTQIAAYHFYEELEHIMHSIVESGKVVRPKAIMDACTKAVDDIIVELKKHITPINEDNLEKIRNIATVSLNNDKVLGDIIYQIYKTIGKEGLISVVTHNSLETEFERVNGFEIEQGYLDKIFINSDNAECRLNDTAIFMFDEFISDASYLDEILRVLNTINEHLVENVPYKYKSLLVIAPGYGAACKTKINAINAQYKNSGAIGNYCFIKFNKGLQHFEDLFYDLSVMTGATIIRNTEGVKINFRQKAKTLLEYINLTNSPRAIKYYQSKNRDISIDSIVDADDEFMNELESYFKDIQDPTTLVGYAKKVVMTENKSTFLEAESNEIEMNKIKSILNNQLDKMHEENIVDFAEEFSIKKRLAILNQNLVQLRIGGQTEQERIATKDLIDDAILACKSAMEFGYVQGCNLATIISAKESINEDDTDLVRQIKIGIFNAFSCIYDDILSTTELQPDEIKEIMEESVNTGKVFNIMTMSPSKDDEIINSVKTEEVILRNIVNIVSIILTSNQYISFNVRDVKELF